MISFAASLWRFSLAGVINTLLGYAVIFGCMAAGMSPYASNLLGYSVGLVCSFVLSKTFVFSARGGARRQALRFLLAFAVAYSANLLALHMALKLGAHPVPAQVIASAVYLITMFGVSRSWVFKHGDPG